MYAIIIITHEDLGEVYLRSATHILGEQPLTSTISVSSNTSCCDVVCDKIKEHLNQLGSDNEVLILADLFGATPCNATMACQQELSHQVKVIAGLNFPMLLKALTCRHSPVAEVVDDIIATAQAGIFDATKKFF